MSVIFDTTVKKYLRDEFGEITYTDNFDLATVITGGTLDTFIRNYELGWMARTLEERESHTPL